jgi:hypothetical protein
MLADVPYNLVIKFFVIYRWLLTITCDESVIPDQCGFWFWLFVILSQIYYRRYIILVFESSWTFFRGESVIADQCGFWFWFFVILLKDIGVTLFLYLNRVGTFFRDRDSMLYKLIWSRFLGSVQGLHGPLGTNGFSWSSSPVMGTTQILALSSRIRILFQDESGSWRNRPCKCREFVRNLLKNKKTTMFVKCHVQRSFPLFSFATWM